jgi:hypothetical protein
MFRSIAIALVLVCLVTSSVRATATGDGVRRVRVIPRDMLITLAQSRDASPTLAALLTELETSNVIVHIVATPPGGKALPGSMHWVTLAGGFRFLRIFIDAQLHPRLRAAMLAHELQHAVEVARAPEVVDAQTFAALYRQIGAATGHDGCAQCYDTPAARRTAQIVWEELRRVRFTN